MANRNNRASKHRAFLVDDDPDTLDVLSYLFETANVEVVKVKESAKALDEFVSHTMSCGDFDLILLDICMPNIDGNELALQICERGFKGPIVALTATPTGAGRRESMDSGFDYYFGKNELTRSVVLELLQK